MPFLLPNQQRQSIEGMKKLQVKQIFKIRYMSVVFYWLLPALCKEQVAGLSRKGNFEDTHQGVTHCTKVDSSTSNFTPHQCTGRVCGPKN